MSIKFKGSAKLDDCILTTCHVKASRRASIVFEQVISRTEQDKLNELAANSINNKNNQVLVKAEVKVACVNLATQKPIAIPADLLREMRSDV